MPPRMRARAESSGRVSVVGTKGLKVGLVGVDVAMVMRLPLARACFSLDGSVSAGMRCTSIVQSTWPSARTEFSFTTNGNGPDSCMLIENPFADAIEDK